MHLCQRANPNRTSTLHLSTTFFRLGWAKLETFLHFAGCIALWTAGSVSPLSVPQSGCQSEPVGFALAVLAKRTYFVCPACWPRTGLVGCPWLCCSGDGSRFHVTGVNTGRCFLVTQSHLKVPGRHRSPCSPSLVLKPPKQSQMIHPPTCLVSCEHVFLIR